jgi:hypothetical protein
MKRIDSIKRHLLPLHFEHAYRFLYSGKTKQLLVKNIEIFNHRIVCQQGLEKFLNTVSVTQ